MQENRISETPEYQPSEGRSKVAIVGFTPSRKLAPWDDESFEIWGLNALYDYDDVKRATRWFDLHKRDIIDEKRIAWYRDAPIPVYLQRAWDDIPGSLRFPKEEIEEEFGRYFTNSISWMIACAAWMEFAEIHVYGVDMATDLEYRYQRPNLEYIIGLMEGRGIKMHVPDTSDLLKATHQYGFGSDSGLRAKAKEKMAHHIEKKQSIAQQIEQKRAEIRQLQQAMATFEGARQAMEWLVQQWGVPDHTSMEPEHPSENGKLPAVTPAQSVALIKGEAE